MTELFNAIFLGIFAGVGIRFFVEYIVHGRKTKVHEATASQLKNDVLKKRIMGELTDEEAIGLIIAYQNGDIDYDKMMKEIGSTDEETNISILAERILSLAREGLIEIKRK